MHLPQCDRVKDEASLLCPSCVTTRFVSMSCEFEGMCEKLVDTQNFESIGSNIETLRGEFVPVHMLNILCSSCFCVEKKTGNNGEFLFQTPVESSKGANCARYIVFRCVPL